MFKIAQWSNIPPKFEWVGKSFDLKEILWLTNSPNTWNSNWTKSLFSNHFISTEFRMQHTIPLRPIFFLRQLDESFCLRLMCSLFVLAAKEIINFPVRKIPWPFLRLNGSFRQRSDNASALMWRAFFRVAFVSLLNYFRNSIEQLAKNNILYMQYNWETEMSFLFTGSNFVRPFGHNAFFAQLLQLLLQTMAIILSCLSTNFYLFIPSAWFSFRIAVPLARPFFRPSSQTYRIGINGFYCDSQREFNVPKVAATWYVCTGAAHKIKKLEIIWRATNLLTDYGHWSFVLFSRRHFRLARLSRTVVHRW